MFAVEHHQIGCPEIGLRIACGRNMPPDLGDLPSVQVSLQEKHMLQLLALAVIRQGHCQSGLESVTHYWVSLAGCRPHCPFNLTTCSLSLKQLSCWPKMHNAK